MSEAESKRIFQRKFNALLAERHVTQREIASICDASTSTVSTWSKGLNMPRMDKIERLANHFGLPKSYFIEDTKKAPTPEGERKISDDDIKFALFGGDGDITDAMYNEVKRFAQMVKLREEAEKKKE